VLTVKRRWTAESGSRRKLSSRRAPIVSARDRRWREGKASSPTTRGDRSCTPGPKTGTRAPAWDGRLIAARKELSVSRPASRSRLEWPPFSGSDGLNGPSPVELRARAEAVEVVEAAAARRAFWDAASQISRSAPHEGTAGSRGRRLRSGSLAELPHQRPSPGAARPGLPRRHAVVNVVGAFLIGLVQALRRRRPCFRRRRGLFLSVGVRGG